MPGWQGTRLPGSTRWRASFPVDRSTCRTRPARMTWLGIGIGSIGVVLLVTGKHGGLRDASVTASGFRLENSAVPL